ncbi:MAG: T9SS type A sorting domain-containing protein [Bacteroidia bacterium]
MHKYFLLLSCFLFTEHLFSQAPVLSWQKCLGGTNEDIPYCVHQTKDKGYIIAGSTKSNDVDVTFNHYSGIPIEDFWVVKTDSTGNIKWQRSLGGSSKEVANSIVECREGGFVVAGYTESNDGDVSNYLGGVSDVWVVRLDTSGNIKWQKTLGGAGEDGAEEIQQTADSGFVVIGWSDTPHDTITNHDFDFYLVKLDTGGNMQWEKYHGGTGDDTPYSVTQTFDGGFVACGYSQSNDGDVTGHHGSLPYNDAWVIKTDATGNLKWQRSFGGTGQEEATCIRQTKDSSYVFTGWATSTNGDVSGVHGSFDYWVVKIDTGANIQWQTCLGGSSVEQSYAIEQTTDGGYVVSGNVYSTNGQVSGNHGGPTDFWVVKLDTAGVFQWQECLGGSNWEASSFVEQTTDGGYILTGSTASNDGDVSGFKGGSYDYWLVKLSYFTTRIPTFKETGILVYPNPVVEKVFVQVNNNTSKTMSVNLYNSLGEKMISKTITDGNNAVSIQDLPVGVYLIEILTDDFQSFKKIIKTAN